MSAQDKTEKVLRELHVMLSHSEIYEKETNRVIVDKKEMLDLLQKLNVCIYEIMDEYELTKQSRDKGERIARKKGEEIVWDASRKAEDVYAASVLYTDEALSDIQDIMQEAMDSVKEVYAGMEKKLQEEKRRVRTNQSELKGHLQDLQDTEKYLKIIDDRNRELEKEKKKDEKDMSREMDVYKAPKPEIRINEQYFEEHGISISDEKESQSEERKEVTAPDIKVNLDAEYFQWKENPDGGSQEDAAGSRNAAKSDGFMNYLFGKK